MNDVFAELGVASDSDGQYNFVTLGEYAFAGQAPTSKISRPTRWPSSMPTARSSTAKASAREIYGNTLAATLAGVRDDEKVKAVVLRVNSPGGSALASDVIWREMELLKAEKPVIVSMGSYAASGGYYISCPGRCHRGRQTDPYGFHRRLRHVPQHHRRPEKQAGHHVRRREEQHLGRHGRDLAADRLPNGLRSCAAWTRCTTTFTTHRGRRAQPAGREGARHRRRPRLVGRQMRSASV